MERAAEECLACRTARGEFASEEVYRDERVVVVIAHHGINPGHLVVVTAEHVRNALTMAPDLLCHMMLVARTMGQRLREALPCPGIMLVFNNEEPCQTLFHAHLHVIPRQHGDEMDTKFGHFIPDEVRSSMAARLRPSLEGSIDD